MDIASLLAQCALFVDVDRAERRRLAALFTVHAIVGGDCLFRAGTPADCLYIVASGRLRAQRPDGSIAGEITRLEPIGEISVIADEPRTIHVHAVRDSLLLRIERDALLAFMARHPQTLLELTRVLIRRLRPPAQPQAPSRATTRAALAILPASPSVPVAAFVERLDAAFRRQHDAPQWLTAARVDAALGPGCARLPTDAGDAASRLIQWLTERENDAERLFYLGAAEPDAWTERCTRQADRLLIVSDDRTRPIDSAIPALLRRLPLRIPVELVLLRSAGAAVATQRLRDWRANCDLDSRHHVQAESDVDHDRLARLLGGRAIGLVLGGGGARGFAHLGLVQALAERRVPIDQLGGTSMGAFFAALLAGGADLSTLLRTARDTFVTHNHLNDYVLPRVSLIRGRRFAERLREIFGPAMLEDLPINCFCVSSNLSSGRASVHREGPLALWVGTSMAVPGVAPPVVWNGDLHADGAITNSLPVDVMRAEGRGPIIASDVSSDGALSLPGVDGPDPEALLRRDGRRPPLSLTDILFRSATLGAGAETRARAAMADLYLRMPVTGIGLFDWKRIDEIVERGYRHAAPLLDRFLATRLSNPG